MPDEPQETIELYFPNIENGTVSVGYCTAEIVNHRARVKAEDAYAIKHWIDAGQAERVTATPIPVIGATDTLGDDPNPFVEGQG